MRIGWLSGSIKSAPNLTSIQRGLQPGCGILVATNPFRDLGRRSRRVFHATDLTSRLTDGGPSSRWKERMH
jgi:hypothetical protein